VLETEDKTGREGLRVLIEVKGTCDAETARLQVAEAVKRTFEFSPQVELLQRGTLATEFERSLKAPRFVDRRQ